MSVSFEGLGIWLGLVGKRVGISPKAQNCAYKIINQNHD